MTRSEVSAAELDESFVPRPKAGVATVPVGNEALLVERSIDEVHALNPTAAVIWSCFDDDASLGEIAADLAATVGLDERRVLGDVVELTRGLGNQGLLEGVATTKEKERSSTPREEEARDTDSAVPRVLTDPPGP